MDTDVHGPEHNKLPSALKVQEGIEQPEALNRDAIRLLHKKRRKALSVDDYMEGILNFNRTVFSQAITLIESTHPAHQELSRELIARCLPYAGNSFRLGITGVPGAGKSTMIEALGMHVIGQGHRLAVLAIDPSSVRTKGSILGDKTRMEQLSVNPSAFIRPSASVGSLGGVARKTRETIVLCEAAGFDTIFVETVGVGQSEVAVHSMVDFFLLILIAGAGDELQGIKRGIMEMADAIVINKADGDNLRNAQIARAQVENALHYFPMSESGWKVPAMTSSATTGKGIPEVWAAIGEYAGFAKKTGYFVQKRNDQMLNIMRNSLEEELLQHFYSNAEVTALISEMEKRISRTEISPYEAARMLVKKYLQ